MHIIKSLFGKTKTENKKRVKMSISGVTDVVIPLILNFVLRNTPLSNPGFFVC